MTTNDPLTSITTYHGEKYYSLMHHDKFEEQMEKKFVSLAMHEGKRIATANIKDFGPATPFEYFEIMVLPKLKPHEKSRMNDTIKRATENGAKPSLKSLLEKLEEIRTEAK